MPVAEDELAGGAVPSRLVAAGLALLALVACDNGAGRAAAPATSPATPQTTSPATSPTVTPPAAAPTRTPTTAPARVPTLTGPLLAYTTRRGDLYLRDLRGRTVRTGLDLRDAGPLVWAGPMLHWDDTAGVHRLDPRTGTVTVVRRRNRFQGLLAARGDTLLVADARYGSGSGGGPYTVFAVSRDDRPVRLFEDGVESGPDSNLPMVAATVTSDGRRLVYGSGMTPGNLHCDVALHVTAWDFARRRAVPIDQPVLVPGTYNAAADGATGLDGRTFLGVRTRWGDCPAKADRSAVFELRGTSWRLFRDGAVWASTGPNGEVALRRPNGDLLLDGRLVARRVRAAAWGSTVTE